MHPTKILYPALLAICALLTLKLSALHPGANVPEENYKLKWHNCSPFPLGKMNETERTKYPEWRAVVFMLTRAAGSDRSLEMLEAIRRANTAHLLIAVVTPDSALAADELQSRHPDARVRIASDSERKMTPVFMGGNMLFPMAFLIDRDGKIIWRGEAADLSEALQNAVNGRIDVSKQKKLAPMIDELQQRMRAGEERAIHKTADQIFRIDPGNPTALRIRLFSLEYAGRSGEAWELLMEQIKNSPRTMRLYFTALDLMLRHKNLRKHLLTVTDKFYDNAATQDEITGFADVILNNFFSDADAIAAVQKFLSAPQEELTRSEKARRRQVNARLAYLLCDLPGAIKAQSEAVELLKEINDQSSKTAEEQLNFYKKLKTLLKR